MRRKDGDGTVRGTYVRPTGRSASGSCLQFHVTLSPAARLLMWGPRVALAVRLAYASLGIFIGLSVCAVFLVIFHNP